MNNLYHSFVSDFKKLVQEARALPLGGLPPCPRPRIADDAPKVLLFSPHPDDECITGALPLRLLRELKYNIMTVAVTQGSNQARKAARLQELRGACGYLGFGIIQTAENGLEKVSLAVREKDPAMWTASVGLIREILDTNRPAMIFMPHDADYHSSHIGTHFLVMDALGRMGSGFSCLVVETEYWQPMSSPNLMIELSAKDLGDLIAATSFHAGEVARNPYHVGMPAWMLDNVRRGSEIVGSQGGKAADFGFAALYRLRRCAGGRLHDVPAGGRQVSATDSLQDLFVASPGT